MDIMLRQGGPAGREVVEVRAIGALSSGFQKSRLQGIRQQQRLPGGTVIPTDPTAGLSLLNGSGLPATPVLDANGAAYRHAGGRPNDAAGVRP